MIGTTPQQENATALELIGQFVPLTSNRDAIHHQLSVDRDDG